MLERYFARGSAAVTSYAGPTREPSEVPGRVPAPAGADPFRALDLWRVVLPADPDRVAGLRRLLSADEIDRADRFRLDEHRARWIVSRAALRRVLEHRTGVPAAAIAFRYGPQGQPRLLAPRVPGLLFNLSRRGALAVIVVGAPQRLGVDIEQVDAGHDLELVAASQFSSHERAAIASVTGPARTRTLSSCWTAKEAYVKATGRGLSEPLQEFDVAVALDRPPGILAIGGSSHEARNWTLRRLDLGPCHVGTVASRDAGRRVLALREPPALHASDLSAPLGANAADATGSQDSDAASSTR